MGYLKSILLLKMERKEGIEKGERKKKIKKNNLCFNINIMDVQPLVSKKRKIEAGI